MSFNDFQAPASDPKRRTILDDIVQYSEKFCCHYTFVRAIAETMQPPKNWTTEVIADKIGVSQTTIRRWLIRLEDGEFRPCSQCEKHYREGR